MQTLMNDYENGMNIFQISKKYDINYHRVIQIIHYMKIGQHNDSK